MGLQTYLPVEILDYVQTHEPPPDSVYGISQRELAKALGYHPCSMSRPLDKLVSDGLLESRRGSVRDGIRKQLTYRLTPAGVQRLRRENIDVPLLSGDVPPPPHPFLGRKEELDTLADIAREGASVTFIDGAPGMGKTALISRHLRRLRRGRILFWFPIRNASSSRQFVSALSHSLSFLGSPQLAYYSQLPRNPVAREVADLAARALGQHSLSAVFDDAQVAGTDVRKFLADFVTALAVQGDHQFYFVGQGAFGFPTGSIRTQHLTVGGLDRPAAHELTDRHGGLADRFETVYQSTLGSPLLLRLAVSNPEITADAATLPTAVVQRLRPEEVRAILPAALANEPLPSAFISVESGLTAARVLELARTGILHMTRQDRVEVLQVVRAAVLTRVSPADEREAHGVLAKYYSRSHRPEALRERFLHLVGGEDWKGAAHLLDEQQKVVLRLGFSETLRSALRTLATALPRGPSKVRVLQVEAALLRAHSDWADAIGSLRRAIVESDRDPRITCESLLAIVDLHIHLAEIDQAEREFENAGKIGPVTRRLQAYFLLTQARLSESHGDSRAAAGDYQRAFEVARRVRSADLALESIAAWSRLIELTSGPETALRVIDAAIPGAKEAGRMDIVFNLLLCRAKAYADLGQGDLAEAEMQTVRSEAESLGYLNQLAYTLSGLTSVAIERSRWADASGYAKQAISLAERLRNDLVLGYTLAMLCSSEFRQADQGTSPALIDEALVHGLRSVEVLGRLPPSDSLVRAHAYLSEVYLFKDQLKDATRHYDTAIDMADRLGMAPLRGTLEAELGRKLASAKSRLSS